jgi:hypothetical protein
MITLFDSTSLQLDAILTPTSDQELLHSAALGVEEQLRPTSDAHLLDAVSVSVAGYPIDGTTIEDVTPIPQGMVHHQ